MIRLSPPHASTEELVPYDEQKNAATNEIPEEDNETNSVLRSSQELAYIDNLTSSMEIVPDYTIVDNMLQNMKQFEEDYCSQKSSGHCITLFNAISNESVILSSPYPFSIGNLERYFGETGHAYSIQHTDNYAIPLALDIDCILCKKRICQVSAFDIEPCNRMVDVVLSLLKRNISNSHNIDFNYAIFKRNQTCSFHIYFSVSVSLFVQQAIYCELNNKLPVIDIQKYKIDKVTNMPLPYSAKKDFDLYIPVSRNENHINFPVTFTVPFIDYQYRVSDQSSIEGKTVLLFQKPIITKEEASFLDSNSTLLQVATVKSRVTVDIHSNFVLNSSNPMEFVKLRQLNFKVVPFNNSVAEHYFSNYFQKQKNYKYLDFETSIVDSLRRICNGDLQIVLGHFLKLMTFICKLHFPVKLTTEIEINDNISTYAELFHVINYLFSYQQYSYLIYCIISTTHRLSINCFDIPREIVAKNLITILKIFIPSNSKECIAIFKNLNNTEWYSNANEELFNIESSKILFHIAHMASHSYSETKSNLRTHQYIFLVNLFSPSKPKDLIKILIYFYTHLKPIVNIDDQLHFFKDGLFYPIKKKTLDEDIKQKIKDLQSFTNIDTESLNLEINFIIEQTEKCAIKKKPNTSQLLINTEIGYFFSALGVYQQSIPFFYFTTQRKYVSNTTSSTIDKRVLIHECNQYFLTRYKSINSMFKILCRDSKRFLLLDTIIPSLLRMDKDAFNRSDSILFTIWNCIRWQNLKLSDCLSIFVKFKIPLSILNFFGEFIKNCEIDYTTYDKFVQHSIKFKDSDFAKLEPCLYEINISGSDDNMLEDINSIAGNLLNFFYIYSFLILDYFDMEMTVGKTYNNLLGENSLVVEHIDAAFLDRISDKFSYTKSILNIDVLSIPINNYLALETLLEKDEQIIFEHIEPGLLDICRNLLFSLEYNGPEFRDLIFSMTNILQPGSFRRKLIVLYGSTGSGKSYFSNLLSKSCDTSTHSLTSSLSSKDGNSGSNPQLISMSKAYFVEIAELKSLDDALVKCITGGDSVNKRLLHSNACYRMHFFGFYLCTTNQFPTAKNIDPALEDRIEFFNIRNKYVRKETCIIHNSLYLLSEGTQLIRQSNIKFDAINFLNLLTSVFVSNVRMDGRFTSKVLNYQSFHLKEKFKAANNEALKALLDSEIHFMKGLQLNRNILIEMIQHNMLKRESNKSDQKFMDDIINVVLDRSKYDSSMYFEGVGVLSSLSIEKLFLMRPLLLFKKTNSNCVIKQDVITKIVFKLSCCEHLYVLWYHLDLLQQDSSFDSDSFTYKNVKISSHLLEKGWKVPTFESLSELKMIIKKNLIKYGLRDDDCYVMVELLLLEYLKLIKPINDIK